MMTWSNNWISEDESIWSILMKFKVANALNNEYLKNTYILPSTAVTSLFEEFFPYSLNYPLLSKQLNFDLDNHFTEQIEKWGLHNIDKNYVINKISKCFRYCSKCIELGFHSTVHQLQVFEFCPFHRQERLIKTCKKCRKFLTLESVFNERDYYKCNCGQYLIEQQNFYNLKHKWLSAKQFTFNQCLFFKNQVIVHNQIYTARATNKAYFNILNCIAKINLRNNCTKNIEPVDNTVAIYKACLRRIRNRCKYKCLKSYYKLGRFAQLCNQCESYLKLRYRFEDINSEWELFSTTNIKKEKRGLITDELKEFLEKLDISVSLKYNLIYYILFYDIYITHQKLLNYVNYNNYDENHVTAFIITDIDNKKILISVHY